MVRVKGGYKTRRRHKGILKMASGYYGAKHRLYKTAKEAVDRALAYAYRDRKAKKRDFRKLWIVRINAAARQLGTSYSVLMDKLKKKDIAIDRKTLSMLAVEDPKAFQAIWDSAK